MAPQEGRQALVERGEGCHRLTALESQAANVNGGGGWIKNQGTGGRACQVTHPRSQGQQEARGLEG